MPGKKYDDFDQSSINHPFRLMIRSTNWLGIDIKIIPREGISSIGDHFLERFLNPRIRFFSKILGFSKNKEI